jgi:hypothetical protein
MRSLALTQSFTYDAENRQATAAINGSTSSYAALAPGMPKSHGAVTCVQIGSAVEFSLETHRCEVL